MAILIGSVSILLNPKGATGSSPFLDLHTSPERESRAARTPGTPKNIRTSSQMEERCLRASAVAYGAPVRLAQGVQTFRLSGANDGADGGEYEQGTTEEGMGVI